MNLIQAIKAVQFDMFDRPQKDLFSSGTHPEKKLVHEKDGGTHMQTFHVSNDKKKDTPLTNKMWTEEQIDAADQAYIDRYKEYQREMKKQKMHGGQHELFSNQITGGSSKDEQLSLLNEIPKEAIAEPITMKQLDRLVSLSGTDKNVAEYFMDIGKKQGAPKAVSRRVGIAFLEYKIAGDLDKYEKVRADFGIGKSKIKKPADDSWQRPLIKALLTSKNRKRLLPLLKAQIILLKSSDSPIIESLNILLSQELAAINQYIVHSEMCDNWGYESLAKENKARAISEMKHAESLIERIIFLDGTPDVSKLDDITIGHTVQEQLELDREAEQKAIDSYNTAITQSLNYNDSGTHELLQDIIEEEAHLSDLDSELSQIEQMGIGNFLWRLCTSQR